VKFVIQFCSNRVAQATRSQTTTSFIPPIDYQLKSTRFSR